MTDFLDLLIKMLPACVYTLMGYIGHKYLKIDVKNLSKIVVYILFPVVIFKGVYASEINLKFWLIFLIFFTLPAILNLIFLKIGKKIWKNEIGNLWAYSLCNTNYGFFGILTGLALFGESALNWMIIASFGLGIYSFTLGYFTLTLTQKESWKEGFKKTLKLPIVYAFLLAVALNLLKPIFSVENEEIYGSIMDTSIDAYALIGMMILGTVISQFKIKFDWKFLSTAMLYKTIFWVTGALTIILLDKEALNMIENNTVYNVLLLFSLIPAGVMAVSVPTLLNYKPEAIAKSASLVIINSIIAIFLIPLIFAFFRF